MQTETSDKLTSVIECAQSAQNSSQVKPTRDRVHSEERVRLMLSVKVKKECKNIE